MQSLKKYLFFFVLVMVLLNSCSDDDGNDIIQKDSLELMETYSVNVKEPSGLAINSAGSILYTVSDNTAQVYKLSITGNVIQTFNYFGNDLEGVSTFKGVKLLLAEERTKELVEFDMGSETFLKHKVHYQNMDDNSGIEGVTYAENLNAIFILNEKNPGKLIRLRDDFTVLAEYDLNFAKDYSGLFYESSSKNLWIVSDQSKTLNKCTLKGDLIKSYSINVTQAEGIAIANNNIYIVSDAEAKLYVFKKPIN